MSAPSDKKSPQQSLESDRKKPALEDKKATKEERLAQALRANLRRRKNNPSATVDPEMNESKA